MSPKFCSVFQLLKEMTFRRIPAFLTHENQDVLWTFSEVLVDLWDWSSSPKKSDIL